MGGKGGGGLHAWTVPESTDRGRHGAELGQVPAPGEVKGDEGAECWVVPLGQAQEHTQKWY